MKTILLAGGKGTRISELTTGINAQPKPMAMVDGRPILWHIMSNYSRFGYNEFIVASGYLQEQIKEYFAKLAMYDGTVRVNTNTGVTQLHENLGPKWDVTVVDTGHSTMTGGRLLRLKDFVDDTFCFTYGDGIADVDISKLVDFHRRHGRLCTVTAVQYRSQFGIMKVDSNGRVNSFVEKPLSATEYISAGYFVCNREVFDYIDDDMTVWEQEPMKRLLSEDQIRAYKHQGFWKCVDTAKDLEEMNNIACEGIGSWLDPVSA